MNSIIGQKPIVSALRRTVINGTVAHSYIFVGEKGMGKKTVVNAFAKALQCENAHDGSACGVCRSCRLFCERRHPDLIYVTASKTKSVGVDDIREQVKHPVQSKPYEFKYKIFIIDEAEKMTVQAQNALLKIIEEPPAYALFIFQASHLHTVLPTVISRCITYRLKPLTDEEVSEVLALHSASLEDVPLAQGNAGRAIDMSLSENFIEMTGLAKDMARDLRGMDILLAMGLFKRFEKFKDSPQLLLDIIYITYVKRSVKNRRETVQYTDAIVEAKKALERNANFQLTVELLLLKLSGKY